MMNNILEKDTLVIKNDTEEIARINNIDTQHFYPHTVAQYCDLMKKKLLKEIDEIPICSVDCHDYFACDYSCKDCLADQTKTWALKNLDMQARGIDLAAYKHVLRKISNFSKRNGLNNIRFEMSGEGNPDLYYGREEIVRFAKEELSMAPVYISSLSKVNESLMGVLEEYADYIRVSMPGINGETYEKYSGQGIFKYEDAIKSIEKLVNDRVCKHKNYIIGVRMCLREDFANSLENVVKHLHNIGVDTVQIVKPITNDKLLDKKLQNQDILSVIQDLKENYGKWIQVPLLNQAAYNQRIIENHNFRECYSSRYMPILYGTTLIPCTHTDIIKNKNLHFGAVDARCSMENLISKPINPQACETCCSLKDNVLFEYITRILTTCSEEKLKKVKFEMI